MSAPAMTSAEHADKWVGYVMGLDGKRYPYHKAHGRERQRIAAQVHDLRHDDHATIRKIAVLMNVSVGTVHSYLAGWRCDGCSGGENGSPEHEARAEMDRA